jgi:dienelactone hydrolase
MILFNRTPDYDRQNVILGPTCRVVKEPPMETSLSRRELLGVGLAAPAGMAGFLASNSRAVVADVHRQLIELAGSHEAERRARFASVRSKADLDALQETLRQSFLESLDGLPVKEGIPPSRKTGTIDADEYTVEKFVFESFPGYFVPALLYRPKNAAGPRPAVLSPCGHSTVGKAADLYQILHVNLARRGYVVLTYDPVGQGERSQFWDETRKRSRFDLGCGEHAVMGNPLYLLGTSLARYRVWDGMRAIDYLTSLPDVDATRIGCVGNSGGGTLTAYIGALDPRVSVAAICCYITTLRRRMANRIQEDPSADPEQDIFGFVSEGIDHAGLLALRVPRPTLIGAARLDFFPIEGARETFGEGKRLYEVAGVGDRAHLVEAPGKHGLALPLRQAVYDWFDRWLAAEPAAKSVPEFPVKPRTPADLSVCSSGQAGVTFGSRHLLPLALGDFDRKKARARSTLRDLLQLDPQMTDSRAIAISRGAEANKTLIVCVNGNESPRWHEERKFVDALVTKGYASVVVDSRGVGRLQPSFSLPGRDYCDPISGVEENIAYNAFLVGKSLLGMRVTDVLAAVKRLVDPTKPKKLILVGRRDAALVACLAAAVEPAIDQVAVEDLLPSFRSLFSPEGRAINAASILPGLLQRFGDVDDILAQIGPRKVLVAGGARGNHAGVRSVSVVEDRFTQDGNVLTDWVEA